MARALAQDARLVVMDEPSAVLAHDEVANLFRLVRQLTSDGVAVVYISHRLDEIRRIGDVVTVLKDGRTVATRLPARTTPTRDVVTLMTGRTVEYVFPPRRPRPVAADVVLQVERLAWPAPSPTSSFTVRAGEIVGIAGLVGSGRSEILETIYGARRRTAGRVVVAGRELGCAAGTCAAVRAGLALAPEERKSAGPPPRRERRRATSRSPRSPGSPASAGSTAAASGATPREITGSLDVRPADPDRPRPGPLRRQPAEGRAGPLAAPGSRGPAARRAHPRRRRRRAVRALRLVRGSPTRGVGVLLVSSEVPEVLGLADRVLVLRGGPGHARGAGRRAGRVTVLDLVMEGSAA